MERNAANLFCAVGLAVLLLHCLCYAESELKIDIVHKPTECERQSSEGDLLSIHYTGKLAADGTIFDSSNVFTVENYRMNKEPFQFQVGRGQVIAGWDQGTLNMCIGEKRTLHIPAHLGYGAQGAGDRIPPNADLHFDIELMDIGTAPAQVNVFTQIDENKDGQLSREEVVGYLVKQIPENSEEKFDQGPMVEEIFQHEDKNKDGYISHEEFSGPKHDEL